MIKTSTILNACNFTKKRRFSVKPALKFNFLIVTFALPFIDHNLQQ